MKKESGFQGRNGKSLVFQGSQNLQVYEWDSFSENIAKRAVFIETQNTLFRVFLSIL